MAQDRLRIEYELVEPKKNFRDESLPSGIEILIPKRCYEKSNKIIASPTKGQSLPKKNWIKSTRRTLSE